MARDGVHQARSRFGASRRALPAATVDAARRLPRTVARRADAGGGARRATAGDPGRRRPTRHRYPARRGGRGPRDERHPGARVAEDPRRRGAGRAAQPQRLHRRPARPFRVAGAVRGARCAGERGARRGGERRRARRSRAGPERARRPGPGGPRRGPARLPPGEPPVPLRAARTGSDAAVHGDGRGGVEPHRVVPAHGPRLRHRPPPPPRRPRRDAERVRRGRRGVAPAVRHGASRPFAAALATVPPGEELFVTEPDDPENPCTSS